MRGGGAVHSGGSAMHAGGGIRSGGGFRSGGGIRSSGLRGGFGNRGGGFHRGNGFRFRGYGFGFYNPGFYNPWFYGGFGYPLWWDSDWSAPYPYDYPDNGYQAGYAGYGYDSGSTPAVIINQQYVPPSEPNSVLREYSYNPPPPAPPRASLQGPSKDEEPLYLIAFNDGVIRAVLAYWTQGSSLHYVTLDHAQKQVTLASVDRGLSARLNAERNVAFQLPR